MLSFTGLLARGSTSFGTGVADLQVVEYGGESWLLAQSAWTAGVTSYQLMDDGRIFLRDQQSHAPGTEAFYDGRITFADTASGPLILSLGHGERGLQAHGFSASGAFSSSGYMLSTGGGSIQDGYSVVANQQFVYVGQREGGITVWSINANGSLSMQQETPRDEHQTALALTQAGTQSFVVSVSATSHAITVWQVAGNGRLSEQSRLEMADGPGIMGPNQIEAVILNGTTFVIVGGAQSGSLSVFELGSDGQLSPTDHVLDGLETRFQNSSALTTVLHDGHVLVLAGGADDGLSVFLLLESGQLLLLDTIADDLDRPLQNVEALAAHALPDSLQIFVSSEAEDRIGQLSMDLSDFGDVLEGGAGNDTLVGGALDDILVAGAGQDRLTGGAGNDTFVFMAAEGRDTITDYEAGRDTVDLSLIPMLYSSDQLTISGTSNGAIITIGDQQIYIVSADGTRLDAGDITLEFGPAHFLVEGSGSSGGSGGGGSGGGGYRLVTGTSADDSLTSTDDNDSVSGLGGDDMLYAGLGADIFDGGDGFDTVSFANAQGRVLVDLQFDVSDAGFARFFQFGDVAGLSYANTEAFVGGGFADNLRGDAGNDSLAGGGVSDRLYGRAGDDTLDGGTGADALYGNMGADIMTGGPDAGRRDRFIYFNDQESGVGPGNRDIITDFVPGEDRIEISRLDADLTTLGNQAFDFIGTSGFSGQAGELRYQRSFWDQTTIVQMDTDGDRQADFEIELEGDLTLSASDFLL